MSLFNRLLNLLKIKKVETTPYWLKITTKVPNCIYYFGPFDSPLEAKALQAGYIEDLMGENAQGIYVELEQCSAPEELTVCQDQDIF
ncbi:DUF1816 domain-containing protein [Pleurocapsales cyanobacterium LEGE 10410]|nr:DUF1816 domain-containing protein [Pleurocapsales cyanobacterium LEGE 10410]